MTNDQVLLEAILAEQRALWGGSVKPEKFFEIFSCDQLLKDKDLTPAEIEEGNIGQGLDGQVDSFFIFADSAVVDDVDSVKAARRNVEIDVWIIQSKTSPSFDATTLEKLQTTILNIFDFARLDDLTTQQYASDLLEKARLFRDVYRATAGLFPKLSIHYRYISTGSTAGIHPNVQSRRDFLVRRTHELFTAAKAQVSFEFVGARELIEMYRRERTYTLTLRLQENPIVATEGYLALINLTDYYNFITDERGELRSYIFDLNVRDYQGSVEVNQDIENSLVNDSDINFWVLNNGVTIIADRGSSVAKDLTLENVQIVNGLQTSRSIFNYLSQKIAEGERRSVLAKIIIKDDAAVIDKVIKASNFQTPIPVSSLKATDEFQRKIEEYFKRHDVFYDRRKGYYKNSGKPANRILGIAALAQAVVSIMRQEPHVARSKPASLVKREADYARVFSDKVPLAAYLVCARTLLATQDALRTDLGSAINEIKSNFKHQITYTAVALTIRKHRFGPPDLTTPATVEVSDENILAAARLVTKWVGSYRSKKVITLDGVAKAEAFTDYVRTKLSKEVMSIT
ncbi:MAG: AIPR family protein [Anaerolineae bacterium]